MVRIHSALRPSIGYVLASLLTSGKAKICSMILSFVAVRRRKMGMVTKKQKTDQTEREREREREREIQNFTSELTGIHAPVRLLALLGGIFALDALSLKKRHRFGEDLVKTLHSALPLPSP